jgi:hypothetical protein
MREMRENTQGWGREGVEPLNGNGVSNLLDLLELPNFKLQKGWQRISGTLFYGWHIGQAIRAWVFNRDDN